MAVADVTAALRSMLDTPIWCAGWTTDLQKPDAFVSLSETILKHETYAKLVEEVRNWNPFMHGCV
jgi:hypothetical protein